MHVPQVLKLFISFIYALLFQVKFPSVPAASRQCLFSARSGSSVCTNGLEQQWQQSVMGGVWERRGERRKRPFFCTIPSVFHPWCIADMPVPPLSWRKCPWDGFCEKAWLKMSHVKRIRVDSDTSCS